MSDGGAIASIRADLESVIKAMDTELTVEDERTVVWAKDPIAPKVRILISSGAIRSQDLKTPPQWIVVPDEAGTAVQDRALSEFNRKSGGADVPRVARLSEFIDTAWDAPRIRRWIESEGPGQTEFSLPSRLLARSATEDLYVWPSFRRLLANNGASHVDPTKGAHSLETKPLDSLQFRRWLDGGAAPELEGRLVFLSADAGMGKSELTRQAQARSTRERDLRLGAVNVDPPVVVRVPLRNLDRLEPKAFAEYISNHTNVPMTTLLLNVLLTKVRLILLLDGLDEMKAQADELEQSIGRLRNLAESGARIMITTRSSFRSAGSMPMFVRSAMGGGASQVVSIELCQLEEFDAISLLRRIGSAVEDVDLAGEDGATATWNSIPPELRGVPLFLIWSSQGIRLRGESATRTSAVLKLIRAVCEREESQESGESTEEQVAALKILAREKFRGEVIDVDWLEVAINRESSTASQFVDGPHALLRTPGESSGAYQFKHSAFEGVLLADALADLWNQCDTELGFLEFARANLSGESVPLLSDVSVDALAEFVGTDGIRRGSTWSSAYNDRHFRTALLRLALADVERRWRDSRPQSLRSFRHVQLARSELLADVIPDRRLHNVRLDRLVIEGFDFEGWRIDHLDARGGEFQFCDFGGAGFDGTLTFAELEACSGLDVHCGEVVPER